MLLYLARHGEAASLNPNDPATLTETGKKQTQRMADELKTRGVHATQIWHSPKARTQETAEIYRLALGVHADRFLSKKELSLDADVEELYEEIIRSRLNSLFLVSHQPLLEELSSFLAAGSDHFPSIVFPPSGIAALEFGNVWKKLWTLDPSQL